MPELTLRRTVPDAPISIVELHRRADEFARTWHDDQLVVDGINFGAIAQLDVYQAIVQMVQDEKQQLWSRTRLVGEMKRSCLDWPIRHALARGWNMVPSVSSSRPQQIDYLFVYDVFNRGMIESILPVQKAMDDRAAESLTFDVRVYRTVADEIDDDRVRLFPSGTSRDPVVADSIHSDLRQQYHRMRHHVVEQTVSAWPGRSRAVIKLLDRIGNRYFRSLADDYLRLQEYLEVTQPRAIGLASDSHRCARTTTFLARQMDIPTLVVQHGATVGRSAYVPVHADRIAVWGKLSADWFRSNDVPDDKIAITGQPRTDRIDRYRQRRRPSNNNRLRVVLATNPIGDRANRSLVKIVGEGCHKVSECIDLSVKLHPGKGDREFLKAEMSPYPVLGTIVQQADLYALLAETDVVITTQSTVGIEALAMGCKLIEVKINDIVTGIPYSDYECVWQVETSEDLAMAIRATLNGSERWEQISRRANQFVQDYLGALDGQSGERVVSELQRLAQPQVADGINFPFTR